MCRVIAPLAAMFRRDAASRPSLPPRTPSAPWKVAALRRRLRTVRHRVLRWFAEPIAIVERRRRAGDVGPSAWEYVFRPRTARHYVRLERATKRVA